MNGQRRLLILFSSNLQVGGVGSSVAEIARALGERDWHVTIALARGLRFHDPALFRTPFPGFETIEMDGRTGTAEGRVQAACRAIARVRPTVVLHTLMQSGYEAARRRRAAGQVFTWVTANRGSSPEHAASVVENRDIVDHVSCVNRLSHEVLCQAEWGMGPERVHYMPNGVPLPTRVRDPGDRRLRIGYAGRWVEDKRFDDFFAFFTSLMARTPEVDAWVAGEGPLADRLRALADDYPDRLRILGALTRTELYERFYPEIDIFVHFSPSEGWCLSIGEAMAHGVIPVTAAYLGLCSEDVVRPGENGMVFDIGDTDTAVNHCMSLIENEGRRVAMSRAAQQRISESFTMTTFADRWAATMAEVANRGPCASGRPGPRHGRTSVVWRERLRRFLGRRFEHAWPGEEWPLLRSEDPATRDRMSSRVRDADKAARQRALSAERKTTGTA